MKLIILILIAAGLVAFLVLIAALLLGKRADTRAEDDFTRSMQHWGPIHAKRIR